jgi:ABC-type glycerol-3-phosphate transport system permease component
LIYFRCKKLVGLAVTSSLVVNTDWRAILAISGLSLVPVPVIFVAFQRYMV